ncbi:MAG: alpha/beta fold hydrolase [Candidatus Micrarchaeaceae archaeon]
MDKFRTLFIKFTSSDSIKLDGILLGNNKKTCVIYVHGMNGNFYKSNIPFELSKQNKFSVFSINTRGHDLISTIRTKTGKKSILAGTGAEVFEDSIKDIKGSINAIKKLGFKNIFLAGHSTGCQKITYYLYKTIDKRIKGIILFAPADDYSIKKQELGKNFYAYQKTIKKLLKIEKLPLKEYNFFTPKRLKSAYTLNGNEAKIYNYNGNLKEFSSIKIPIFVIFGSKEQYKDRDVSEYMNILKIKTKSKYFCYKIIKNANHSFYNYEKELTKNVKNYILKIGK